jgi:hypothetical protein
LVIPPDIGEFDAFSLSQEKRRTEIQMKRRLDFFISFGVWYNIEMQKPCYTIPTSSKSNKIQNPQIIQSSNHPIVKSPTLPRPLPCH